MKFTILIPDLPDLWAAAAEIVAQHGWDDADIPLMTRILRDAILRTCARLEQLLDDENTLVEEATHPHGLLRPFMP
jgi:hypothetical protein